MGICECGTEKIKDRNLKIICTEVIIEDVGIHDISERRRENQRQGQRFQENLYLGDNWNK